MKRMRIMGLCLVAVFAIAAVFAGSASAKTVLTLKTTGKGALKGGEMITASSSDLIFETAGGNLECSSNILEGPVAVNGAAKDSGTITSESSTGTELEPSKACKTTTAFGPAVIESKHLPWGQFFKSNGSAETKKGANGKVTFTSVFPLGGPGAECTFEAAKVKSSFTVGGPLTLTVTEQVFKRNKKISNELCPTSGKLSGHFSVTAGGETVET